MAATHTTTHPAHEAHVHHELPFMRKYIFSTDHKVIGIQYGITALLFLLFGFLLMAAMRWQIAYPNDPIPVVGGLMQKALGDDMVASKTVETVNADGTKTEVKTPGIMTPDLYNAFGAMHGTIMVFLAIVPLAFGAFGNFVVPLQIGAPDMAFPRINMVSYQCYFAGGVVMLASFFIPGGAAKSGWTSYSPLASIADLAHRIDGQTFWLIGMVLLITSSLLGAVNFIATIIQLRTKGMSWMRLPFFVWAQFVTGFLLLLAFPPLEAAGVMQLMDNVFDTSFFLPSGLVIAGQTMDVSGGGSPLLWQHLFWFLGHPEVYVLILPAMGIVAEIIACNTRKPLWGYKALVHSVLAIGFLSFIVWAHHMYLTGMGTKISTFFQTTTMIISIPSVIILDGVVPVLVGRIDPLQYADALRARVSSDVRHWRSYRIAARFQRQRHPPARHLLRHCALPLRGGAGNDFRSAGGHLLLVSQSDRPFHERVLGPRPFRALLRVHEPHLRTHVFAGSGRNVAPHVRWWCDLFDRQLTGRRGCTQRVYHQPQQGNLSRSLDAWCGPDSIHHQLLLEH